MTLLEILKLVGFGTGAALHLYIAWLIWRKRLRGGLNQSEHTFIVLSLCLGAWFFGNLFTTLHELLLGPERLTSLRRVWDAVSLLGIAPFPAALFHAHIAFWSWSGEYRLLRPHHVRWAALFCYSPMVMLPYAIYLIADGPYQPFFASLRSLLLPYSVWYMVTLWSAAAIDWRMKDRLFKSLQRERTFLTLLAAMLFLTGAFQFLVVGLRARTITGLSDSLWVGYILLSLLPTFTIAYYIYRYNLFDLVIKGSLVYAAFAVAFIAVYTFVVRSLDEYLVRRFDVRPGVIEALLILGMVSLTGPAVRAIDRMVHRLFSREIGMYRDVVRQVPLGAAGIGEVAELVRYLQDVITRGLKLSRTCIHTVDGNMPEGPERRIAERLAKSGEDIAEPPRELAESGAAAVYALRHNGELTGLMIVFDAPDSFSSDKQEVLVVLAGQVATAIATCRLVEEKVRLERELASRERMASLGRMAATVAHEVKNPLSSIKSITQVLREDKALASYDRDLELVIGEVDRLSRTVSQLLAFSRPGSGEADAVPLKQLVRNTVELLNADARRRGVIICAGVESDLLLSGPQAAAIGEALTNLLVNAVQASEPQGEVIVETSVESRTVAANQEPRSAPGNLPSKHLVEPAASAESVGATFQRHLVLSVSDNGPGIAEEAQARVFEPFYTTKARGTGLGLAIAERRIIELGGQVELTSPVNGDRGARIRLIIPLPPGTSETAFEETI
jgi:signal transduction histidine kinase